jgi:PKHD-type hydroxylase
MPAYPFPINPLPQFTEYLWIDSVILPHELNQIHTFWNDQESQQGELEGDETPAEEIRKSSVVPLSYGGEMDWLFDRLAPFIAQANQYYNFDLRGFYEPFQLSEYKEGDFFDWHLDFGTGASSIRKLSFSIQLSNPKAYEGGDLEFRINNNIVQAPRTPGTVIIFPSFVMHRVSKVTKGTRRSIVGWIAGPPYK